MNRPAGLRERKKQATRTALADAALRLCVEHGVEAVTVEQVARDAGVSLRTFFNYFSSKEEAIVAGDAATAEALVRAFAGRPPAEPVLEALRRALVEIVADCVDRAQAEQLRALRRAPSLLPHQMAAFHAQERALAGAVAERMGVEPGSDLFPNLLAATVMTALRVVVAWWLDAGDGRPLADLVETAVDQLDAGFARQASQATGRRCTP
ncbi:TetR/AcrR family transcriptional regulator [Saccharothrix australiensis]|uniref:TetR family transcriptional regulator n=1 Tax=Saccharothrix australiensis TaxID=2072 RepID=A0A495W465_9PSEU|nr:TetR family transcriptional regulator [Saccharothrix australiensis]RKT56164.1 TetR family transcriptional regulator [Saccharothrix australiensis]